MLNTRKETRRCMEKGRQESRMTRGSHHPCPIMDPTIHRKPFSCAALPRAWSNIPPRSVSGPAFGELGQILVFLFRSSFIEITLDSPTICHFKCMMRRLLGCHLSPPEICHCLTKTSCILRCHPLACSGGCFRFLPVWT